MPRPFPYELGMRIALKEWAVVVDALGRGEQILIFRKGGLRESEGGFRPEHERFWLFPTWFHSQDEAVIASARPRFRRLRARRGPAGEIRLSHYARLIESRALGSLDALRALKGQHIWHEDALRKKFEWAGGKYVVAMVVRVFALRQARSLPMIPEYGGCRSWVELAEDLSELPGAPVLENASFEAKVLTFRDSLG